MNIYLIPSAEDIPKCKAFKIYSSVLLKTYKIFNKVLQTSTS